jgi:AmmeMemoRadiSam system protein B/AmmeMemoRadiSam system protein A
MRKLLLLFWCLGIAWAAGRTTVQTQTVRPAAVAGSFYPADAKELAQMVDGFVAKATPPPVPHLLAIVAPHAGYQFSGHVAGWSYALIKGRHYQRVVVIAPSHYEAFPFASVFDGAAYTTPLGRVQIDQAFAKKLASASPLIRLSGSGHTPDGDKREHSVEVQLPFLQRVLGDFQLVPVVMGDQEYATCRALGLALAKLAGPETLIVASSDLSHYHTYDEAVRMDHKTLTAIEEWDYLSMSRNFPQRIWEACGGGPIIAAMIATERLGANQAIILKYANSGDVTADRSRVVGYGAVVLAQGPARKADAGPGLTLNGSEQNELLRVARKSVETVVRQHKLYEYSPPASGPLAQERGAFVTLTKHGELRGCIGFTAPSEALALTVRDVAAWAAVRDRRFTPVTADELPELDYEISVLSPLRRVLDVKQIRPGRDGLVMKRDDAEGLLLPQVATDQHWDRLTFLKQTCRKAGLAPDAWQDGETDIFSFTALVFGGLRARPSPEPDLRVPSATLF